MDNPFIIGITGGSGSGKTSLLRDLRRQFSVDELCILSLDDYYIEREKQEVDEKGIRNFDRPLAVDLKAFYQDIERLLRNEEVTRKEYTFNNRKKTPKTLTFKPAPLLALEGLYVFYDPVIREKIDLKVFIHASPELKVIRRIRRDEAERNYPLEDVLYRYENHVLPSFSRDIARFHETSDIVINNNSAYDTGLDVLTGFLKYKLQES
ncbi:MAG: uridine kinase [Saprospiraceae bacterium]|nr:uridine kinase [Saprospiraceae bacterium]